MAGKKYWVANAPGTTAASTTISNVQASNLAAFPTTTVGVYNLSQANFDVANVPIVVDADSTSAIASATLTGAANTIAGFIKIQMNSTTGLVDRYIYTYAVSPTG